MPTGYATLGQKRAIKNKLHVKLWMINNQFSRRNLSIEMRLALAYQFKEFEAERAKARQLSTLKQFSKQEETTEISQSTDSPLVGYPEKEVEQRNDLKGKTLEIIAQKAGVSRSTAEQYDAIHMRPSSVKALRKG